MNLASADDRARRIASDLLAIGAVALSPGAPFTWASGLRSPIYCDNRLTLAFPDVRARIADAFSELLHQHGLTPGVVIGTATAGIPHAAWLAERLNLPMAYVRSKPKEHGRGNQIEGRVTPGEPAIVVEDTVSTGGSSVAAVRAVQAAGVPVAATVSIFSYGFPDAALRFEEAGVPLWSLTTYEVLVEVARAEGRLSQEELETLHVWKRDPHAWSAAIAGA